MNPLFPSSPFESRDAILYEFIDTELEVDDTRRPASDESVRRGMSERFGKDQAGSPVPPQLERLLALAREREQFCRGAHDMFGLARCLGNQALFHKIAGRVEDCRALLAELELLCRRIEDREGLTFALYQQAALLAGPLRQPGAALPLAEQARHAAIQYRLGDLASLSETLIQECKARLGDDQP